MSAAVRQELADAASSVEGIKAHPFYVQGTSPGHGWVRLDRIEYPDRFGGIRYWNVVVVLPQDMAKAEQYLEDHLQPLLDALTPLMTVRQAVPQRLDTGAGVLPCVFINGSREE